MKKKFEDEKISGTFIEKNQKKQETLNVINSMITGIKNEPHR